MTVTCPACGNINQEESESCSYCGAPLPAAGAAPEEAGRASATGQEPVGAEGEQQAGEQAVPGQQPAGDEGFAQGWQSAYASPPAYGAAAPWYPPYYPYGFGWPYPGYGWWPCMPPFFACPFPFMSNPGMYGGYPAAQQYAYAAPAPRKRMRPLFIVLIIIGALIVIGGGVAAAVLLTGSTNATFRIGDGEVTGADITFSDMVLKQEDEVLALTGTYDNNTKSEGDVIVTIQAISKGQEELVSFTVPVEAGTNKSFTEQKPAGSIELSGATLSSLVFEYGSTFDSGDQNTYPYDQGTQPSTQGQTTTQPTFPSDALPPDQELYLNEEMLRRLSIPTTFPVQ